jgi:purine nucleosidase
MAPIPVILDVDTGIDDALAILYALASPRLDVIGLTTCFGNVALDDVVRNTLVVTDWAGAAVPVYRGAERALAGAPLTAEGFHGRNGLGDAPIAAPSRSAEDVSAVEFLLETFRRRPGEITLVTTGRLTNLAALLLAEPRARDWLGPVVVMGGAFFVPGNVTPVAEANIIGDPEAARHVLLSGVRPVLVGLDVTQQALLEDRDVDGLDPEWEPAPLVRTALDFYLAAYNPGQPRGRRSCPLHDPLAVAVAEDPSLVTAREYAVDVETAGIITRGMTVADARARSTESPNATVAVGVDAPRFLQEFRRRLHMRAAQ